jgi:hypothetical protein
MIDTEELLLIGIVGADRLTLRLAGWNRGIPGYEDLSSSAFRSGFRDETPRRSS